MYHWFYQTELIEPSLAKENLIYGNANLKKHLHLNTAKKW